MKMRISAGVMLAFAIVRPVSAADDAGITRMALCRDSWVAWTKTERDQKTFLAFRDHVMGAFKPHHNDPYWLPKPKVSVSVLGLHVAQLFPASVGMGVGFSLMVDAPYDTTRKVLEKSLGKTLQHCEASDGTRGCELEIAPQRTIMLMAEENPKSRQTLIGCYYYYEK